MWVVLAALSAHVGCADRLHFREHAVRAKRVETQATTWPGKDDDEELLAGPIIEDDDDADNLDEDVEDEQEPIQMADSSLPAKEQDISAPMSKKVEMYLVRHAFSCANLVNYYGVGARDRIMHTQMPDPMLTSCGELRSRKGAARLDELKVMPDIVLSSSLLRAIQTASLMFPNTTVTPVPYISEQSPGSDNRAADVEIQRRRLVMDPVSNVSSMLDGKVDLSWMTHDIFGKRGPRTTEPNFRDFLSFMAEVFLPQIPAELKSKETLKIAVVTHSHFLAHSAVVKQRCRKFYEVKPRNNQVLQIDFKYSAGLVLTDEADDAGLRAGVVQPLDPYVEEGGDVLEALHKSLLQNSSRQAHLDMMQQLLTTKMPKYWKKRTQPGVKISVTRELKPQPGCKSLYDAETDPKYICKADVGETCQGEIKSFRYLGPRLRTRESAHQKLNSKVNKMKKEDNEKFWEYKQRLEEVEKSSCCIDE